jgi:hypothetical protein
MKKTVIICFILFFSCFCYAQYDWKAISDSLALESRAKADIVLSKFDTISGKKILYSLLNKEYYIIIQSDTYYKEYIVSIDSICNILGIKEIDNSNKIRELKSKKILSKSKRKFLQRLEADRQTVKEAFNTSQYGTELITSVPNATYVAGVPSYFVMKDESNNRYGEYSLSSITVPCPINPDLWAYLVRELSENKN